MNFGKGIKNFLFNPIFIFIIIILTLVAIWFKGGNPLGGGEIGAPYYNISRMFDISSHAWSDIGLGMSSGFEVMAVPIYWVFTQMQIFGIPGFLIQATFFLINLTLCLFSVYALTKELFPGRKRIAYFSAAIFYLINPYALVNIWNRFLQNPMLFYSFLPLGIWLFIRGLNKKNYTYAVLNMVLTVFFSLAFAGPSQILIFWSLLFLTGVYYFVFIERNRFVINYFLLSSVLWLIFNFFWISQDLYYRFSQTYTVVSSLFFTNVENLQTFVAQSKVLGQLSNLFLFQHGPFFNQSVDLPYKWPLIYVNPFVKTLEWFVILLILLLSIKRRKNTWTIFLLMIFVLGIFSSKGNSPPFGELFDFLFRKISFLEFFRNPFEKLGLLLPLSFAPLLGLAYEDLRMFVKGKLRLVVDFGILFYLVILLGFPFWTGLIFTSGNPPANDLKINIQVEVPDYYQEANNYLLKNGGLFRFITFPLGGEGIFYKWPKGYVGVEQSALLFSTPNISFNTGIPYYSELVGGLEQLFIKRVDFYKVARLFNSQYLLFRPDFDFKLSYMRDPETINGIFALRINDPDSKLTFVSNFGSLKLYKYLEEAFLPKIYAAEGLIINNLSGQIGDIFFGKDNKNYTILTIDSKNQPSFVKQSYADVEHNYKFFEIDSAFPSYSNEAYIFAYVNNLPSSKVYPLILLKEKLQGVQKISLEDKANWGLSLLGKRLVEAKNSVDQGDYAGARKALDGYMEMLPSFESKLDALNLTVKQPDENVWHEQELFKAFSSHLYLLEEIRDTSLNEDNFVSNFIINTKLSLSKENIIPVYDAISAQNFLVQHRIIYQIDVTNEGDYEILIPQTKLFPNSFDFPNGVNIQVDNTIISRQLSIKDQYISLGRVHLKSGMHDIGINQIPDQNLVSETKFDIVASDKDIKVTIPIEGFDTYQHYRISFDYWVRYGAPLNYFMSQNSDQVPTKSRPQSGKDLTNDNYIFDFRTFYDSFQPQPSADAAAISFTIKPWNNCLQVYKGNPKKCDDSVTKAIYGKPTEVLVKNIKVFPDMPRDIVLLKQDGVIKNTPSSISFNKINSTKYVAHIQGAKDAFLLIFSELFDSNWKAHIVDNGVKVNEIPFAQQWRKNVVSENNHFLVNGYANAWWIDKVGDFGVVLEYEPQRLLNIGYAISAISIFVALGYISLRLFLRKIKK